MPSALSIIFILGLVYYALTLFNPISSQAMATAKKLTFSELDNIMSASDPHYTLIDVRGPGEFAAGHVAGAHNLPVSDVKQALGLSASDFASKYAFDLPKANDTNNNVIVMCKSGKRAGMAITALVDAGYKENLYAYLPGWDEYSVTKRL